MATQLPKEQTVTIEELVLSHSYEMLALITVLERKGILNRAEIIEVIKELKVTNNVKQSTIMHTGDSL